MIALRRLVATLVLIGLLVTVGGVGGVDAHAWWAELPTPMPLLVQGLVLSGVAAWDHPRAALLVAAVVCLPFLAARIASWVPRQVVKDPQRMYTTAQRQAGFARAEGRCEMEDFFFLRCERTAEHGDHWFPWSKGGATDMANFVAGCAKCNIAKSDRTPTFFETQRLAFRRRKYFPAALEPTPGNRYRRR